MPTFKVRGTNVMLPYSPELTPAETRLVFRLQKHFDPVWIFPELYLPRTSQKSGIAPTDFLLGDNHLRGSEITQIDCLAINEQGIFIFESKDYTGYVYGSGVQHYWTQVTQYGKAKYRFYNPIRQNQTHIRAIQQILGANCEDIPVYSVVVFGPNATLKDISDLPENNFVINQANIPSLLHKIPQNQLDLERIAKIGTIITTNRLIPNAIMRRDHVNDTSELIKE